MSFGTYASNQSDWNFRKWLLPMLIVSLFIHACLMAFFNAKKLTTFVPVKTERLIPRAFNMKRAEIDPRSLQDAAPSTLQATATKPIPDITKLNSDSKAALSKIQNEIRASPSTPSSDDLSKPIVNEKPSLDATAINSAMTKLEAGSSRALEREMEQLRKALTADRPSSSNQPSLTAKDLLDPNPATSLSTSDIAAKLKGGNVGPDTGGGFSNLDELLGQTGPLTSGTAPILMPTDLLFDYDSFTLRQEAVSSIVNLGKLIQKNPNATFIIEGHTDSFGTPEYNRPLSKNRAESVKSWLVSSMSIDPSRIETRGFGSSKLLVSPNKSVEEQQLNRRVEIVIRTK